MLRIYRLIRHARQTVRYVVVFLKSEHTALDYYSRYKANKKCCGQRPTVLSTAQQAYVEEKVAQGWTMNMMVDRQERPVGCSMRLLSRMFEREHIQHF